MALIFVCFVLLPSFWIHRSCPWSQISDGFASYAGKIIESDFNTQRGWFKMREMLIARQITKIS
jgi:hypothetical protein